MARYSRHALQSGGLDEADIKKFQRYHNEDLEWVLRRIKEKAPDIIIQDVSPRYSWLSSELGALSNSNFLQDYEPIARRRRDPNSPQIAIPLKWPFHSDPFLRNR